MIETAGKVSSLWVVLFLICHGPALAQQNGGNLTAGQRALLEIEQEARDCPEESRRSIEEKKKLIKSRNIEITNTGTSNEEVNDRSVAELNQKIINECVYD